MIKHFIFDFDGTISDSYAVIPDYFLQIAKENGIPAPDREEIRKAAQHTLLNAFELFNWPEGYTFREHFLPRHRELAIQNIRNLQIFPEAKELLEWVAQNGGKNYIYTHSGFYILDACENMGVRHLITDAICNELNFPSKPAPDALLYLMDKHGLDPRECMMIGDRPLDAQAGQNAGMYGCLWDSSRLFAPSDAEFYTTDLLDVKKICQTLS